MISLYLRICVCILKKTMEKEKIMEVYRYCLNRAMTIESEMKKRKTDLIYPQGQADAYWDIARHLENTEEINPTK
jgi:hypothetical protein